MALVEFWFPPAGLIIRSICIWSFINTGMFTSRIQLLNSWRTSSCMQLHTRYMLCRQLHTVSITLVLICCSSVHWKLHARLGGCLATWIKLIDKRKKKSSNSYKSACPMIMFMFVWLYVNGVVFFPPFGKTAFHGYLSLAVRSAVLKSVRYPFLHSTCPWLHRATQDPGLEAGWHVWKVHLRGASIASRIFQRPVQR